MRREWVIYRILPAFIFLAVAGFAGVSYLNFQKDVDALRKASQENIFWTAAQLEIELGRFLQQVTQIQNATEGSSPSKLQDSFDILWSRVGMFNSGRTGHRLRAYDSESQIVDRLFADMKLWEDRVFDLRPGDVEGARAVLEGFGDYPGELHGLTKQIFDGEETLRAAAREDLRYSARLSEYLSASAILIGFAVLAYLFAQMSRLVSIARRNEALAEAATRANEAKSRFLAMMSHELRTPMNGVMGLLALSRQTGLPPATERLIAKAEHSGRQMSEMLEDILEYSAVAADAEAPKEEQFALNDLRLRIETSFAAKAQREGVLFNVMCSTLGEQRMVGDIDRIAKAVIHLATHVTETAATENIRLCLGFGQGGLSADLSFDYRPGAGRRWRPRAIAGPGDPEAEADLFATDAIGPVLARRAVERLGGRIDIGDVGESCTVIRVQIPCRALKVEPPLVLLRTSSSATRLVCESILGALGAPMAEDAGAGVDLVLLEAPGRDEAEEVEALRREAQEARIVCLGAPERAQRYDRVVGLPLEVNALREVVEEACRRTVEEEREAPKAVRI